MNAPDHQAADGSNAHGLRVLLAEDNPVNRRITLLLLKRAGHLVHCVENGREAVEAVQAQPFDLVVMDVQMPELDGMSATRAIRDAERTQGGHLPILALTAQAMAGDKERCLEAGMDAYVSKPFRPETLFREIRQLTGSPVPPATGEETSGAYDPAQLLSDLGGDEDLMKEVLGLFLDEGPRMLEELTREVARSDSDGIARTAHGLKGALLAIAAGNASAVALELEEMGRRGEVKDAPDKLAALTAEMSQLKTLLSELAG